MRFVLKAAGSLFSLFACVLLLGCTQHIEASDAKFPCVFNPSIPENISKDTDQPICKGFLDVTKPPYRAKGDGITDDTEAINLALQDAFQFELASFFPADKRFLVSNQLGCVKHSAYFSANGFQLIGSTKGKPPVLVLKDHSTVKDNILVYFALITPGGYFDAPDHYGQLIRNIHIQMGNNPQVSAVSMSGAQFCSIEDVAISGDHFYAGIVGLPGSGGFSGNIEVVGGQIGILQNQYRPVPSVTNLVLSGQSTAGVLLNISRGPLVISGFRIVGPKTSRADYRAVKIHTELGKFNMRDDGDGALALEDGSLQVTGDSGVAIQTYGSNIALKHVYVQASTVVEMIDPRSSQQALSLLKCGTNMRGTWSKIDWVFTTSKSNVWIGSEKLTDNSTFSYPSADRACSSSAPPSLDLAASHSWNSSMLPSWEDIDLVDIVTDYGATQSWLKANDDDGVKIQQALNDTATEGHPNFGYVVFIPCGTYHIAKTLIVPAGSRILGGGKFAEISVQNKYFQDWAQDTPVILTEDAKALAGHYGIVLADLQIRSFARGTWFNIRTENILVKDIIQVHYGTAQFAFDATGPMSLFSGNAGGHVYATIPVAINFDQIFPNLWSPLFSLMLVNGTRNPLHFYQATLAHQPANFEFVVDQSSNVHMHAFKFESVAIGAKPPPHSHPVVGGGLMAIRNSQNVTIFGGCGNFGITAPNISTAIIEITKSVGIEIQAVNRRPQEGEIKGSWLTNSDNVSFGDDVSVLFYTDNTDSPKGGLNRSTPAALSIFV